MCGALAQLGERVLCKHEVIGSIPIGSTIEAGSASGRRNAPVERFEGFDARRADAPCGVAGRASCPGLLTLEIGSVAQVVRAHA